ncbi:hypothetical protein Bacsa_1303 [Phocaeicola salanitronis DSM 18170]|uniref:Uncharacterized protein n=1 Tax=Phocaeicola salanitronis (strain DSM 18170 / JCM 13657 / CCUG 60908 / BL78) TaxID=667015 RepID=F0R768_PHOSB|nr:hypothetical protein Bacsa_1303 [Phocaeicola salanitronis DSM 18170]
MRKERFAYLIRGEQPITGENEILKIQYAFVYVLAKYPLSLYES